MTSRSIQNRVTDFRDSVKGFIVVQHQRLIAPSQPSRQEHLNTSSMIKILVIGETGSGKSTFINYLTNYFKSGTLQNIRVAIPSTFHPEVTENFEHHEHDVYDKTQSKTDSCNQYMFIDGNSQYLFIDTPGLSDTRGAEQDKINLNKIIEAVEALGGLTAVIIVVNGAIARLTVNLRNVIAQLRGNLPDIVMDNVIVILTNTTRHTANFSLTALELNGNVYPYYMQNSAFSTDPSKWTSTAMHSLQHDWDQAMNELKAMVKTLNTFRTKSVAAFKNMKDIRNAIKALMHAARVEVVQIQKMQDEIAMFEAGRKQAAADAVTYKDYTKERIVDKVELVDASYHSTLCQNCNHVCHDNCGLDETTATGAQIFQQCWAMSNGNCQQCQHHCSYTAHYHAKKTVKVTKQTLKDVLADIKSRYDAASQGSTDFQKKITSTEDAKKLLEKALQQKNAEIKARCNELRQICSGFNLAAELHALIDQLEIEAAMLRNIDARKQAEIFIRSLKEFCASIEKDQNAQQAIKNGTSRMNIIDTEQHIEGQSPMTDEPTITTNVSNQNSNKSTTNSGSYASGEVLNQIRAMSGNSSKKKEKRKSEEKLQESVESADDDDESEDEINAEITSMTTDRKSSKKQPSKGELSRAQAKSTKPDVEEFKKLSITELIKRYRACEDQRTRDFIMYELKQRSHGKSVAPLNDPADIAAFMASTQKYCALDSNSLKHAYDQLKEQICAIMEPDILEIEKVPSVLLHEIAAVHQLMKGVTGSANSGGLYPALSGQQPVPSHLQQPPSPFYHQQQVLPSYQHQHPLPLYQQQPPLSSYQQHQQLLFHQQQQDPRNSFFGYPHQHAFEQNYLMGNARYPLVNTSNHMSQSLRSSHLSSDEAYSRGSPVNVPYHQEHFLQRDPQHYIQTGGFSQQHRQSPVYIEDRHFQRHDVPRPVHHSDSYSNSRPASSPYQNQYNHSEDYQQHGLQNVTPSVRLLSTPRAPIHSSSSSASHLSDTFDKMRVTSSFRPIEPNTNRLDTHSPRSRSSSGFSEFSSRANSTALPSDLLVDDLRRYTNTNLLAVYDDAIQKRNRSQQHAIYMELERRCYGDHPRLINEKQTLFDEKCNFFRRASLDELRNSQSEVQQKIRSYLNNDDATGLNDIPTELIVEAAALNHLIKEKTSQE